MIVIPTPLRRCFPQQMTAGAFFVRDRLCPFNFFLLLSVIASKYLRAYKADAAISTPKFYIVTPLDLPREIAKRYLTGVVTFI